jgi:septum formation protein
VDDQQARPRLVLASASPARWRLLDAAGIDADVMVSGVDEDAVTATAPQELCLLLARLKAEAVADRLRGPDAAAARTLVLGCDSVLAFNGAVLGKPADRSQAVARWRHMRGRSGVLHTGHAVVDVATGRTAAAASATVVHFADVRDEEIDAYVATGEPLAVAGAFTIDGIGAPFVARIEGDHGTVVGLSLPLLRDLLAEIGVAITTLWRDGAARAS